MILSVLLKNIPKAKSYFHARITYRSYQLRVYKKKNELNVIPFGFDTFSWAVLLPAHNIPHDRFEADAMTKPSCTDNITSSELNKGYKIELKRDKFAPMKAIFRIVPNRVQFRL